MSCILFVLLQSENDYPRSNPIARPDSHMDAIPAYLFFESPRETEGPDLSLRFSRGGGRWGRGKATRTPREPRNTILEGSFGILRIIHILGSLL